MNTDIGALTVIFTEFYYWVTIPLMFLIHVGFCMYEVGATRHKNHMHTLMKNTMLIPLVTITFFFFGWWIYFAFPNGPWITGKLIAAPHATAWSELMGTHLGGQPETGTTSAEDNGILGPHQRCFLGGIPAVLLDSGFDRLRFGHRTYPPVGLLDHCGPGRFLHLDHRRRMGLAPRWLDGYATGLPRCLRFGSYSRDCRRCRAGCPDPRLGRASASLLQTVRPETSTRTTSGWSRSVCS